MSEGRPAERDKFPAVNIVGLVIGLAEISGAIIIVYSRLSVNLCLAFISFVALSFAIFLFGVARNQGRRNVFVALLFVISNVAAIIITFGGIYSQLGLIDPTRYAARKEDFTTIWDGIYFSIITLTTVGYGDVTPRLHARSIAAFEALTGYVIMGLLISVIVVIAQRTKPTTGGSGKPQHQGGSEKHASGSSENGASS